MSSPYTRQADTVLIGMHDYLSGFTVYHSDVMYNYYKEKVFTITYDQILENLAVLYKISKHYFDNNKLNSALTILHKKFKEYEAYYMEQRDLAVDISRTDPKEIDIIPLNLERYTATFIRHLVDLKIGFNLFLIVETQRKFFKEHGGEYDTSKLDETVIPSPSPSSSPIPEQSEPEVSMNITNMDGTTSTNMPQVNPEEFMIHLNALRNLANNYFDTHIKPGTRYELQMRLRFL